VQVLEQDLPALHNDQILKNKTKQNKKPLLVCFGLAIWGKIVNNSSENKNS